MSVLTALKLFNDHKDKWSGTYVGVFQHAEETAQGARDMVDNNVADVLPPLDVYLGQHVLASIPGGTVGSKPGSIFTAAASIRVKVFGKGSHGSMPQLGIDPVVLASYIVMRLQTIVAREIAPSDTAVVTVGSIQAGAKSNIIPDDATLLINPVFTGATVSNLLINATAGLIPVSLWVLQARAATLEEQIAETKQRLKEAQEEYA